MIRILAIAATLALSGAALAAPPPGADPAQAPFFEGLQRYDGGGSCCGQSDCRPVETRSPDISPSHHWEAWIGTVTFGPNSNAPNQWVIVPDRMVNEDLTTKPRPWQAIACWYPGKMYDYKAGADILFPGGGHLICFTKPQASI